MAKVTTLTEAEKEKFNDVMNKMDDNVESIGCFETSGCHIKLVGEPEVTFQHPEAFLRAMYRFGSEHDDREDHAMHVLALLTTANGNRMFAEVNEDYRKFKFDSDRGPLKCKIEIEDENYFTIACETK